jgi:hypothetical protein
VKNLKLKEYNDLSIIKQNLDEILGFYNSKISPAVSSFITKDMTILSSGLISNLVDIPIVEGQTFYSTISKNAYNLYTALNTLDDNLIELSYYADLTTTDISKSTFTTAIYLLASNQKVIDSSSLLSEFYSLQAHSVFYLINKLLKAVMTSSCAIQRLLSNTLSANTYSSCSMDKFSTKEITEIVGNIRFIERLIETTYQGDNLVISLLRELRKLEFNLVIMKSFL